MEFSSDHIKNLLGDKYLERFKVKYEATLFGPDWSMLKDYRCPLCTGRLRIPMKNPNIFMCGSRKHGKAFIIGRDKLNKTVDNLLAKE